MFEKITAAPADPILGLADTFRADSRDNKINLGIGVYKDESGKTPVLDTVKKAEKFLLENEKHQKLSGDKWSARVWSCHTGTAVRQTT